MVLGEEESELVRLNQLEQRLIRNYRIVNDARQDTLLYFSEELVKIERTEIQEAAKNVVLITRKK